MSEELKALEAEAVAVDAATQPQPVPEAGETDEPTPEAQPVPTMTPEEEASQIVGLMAFAIEKLFPVLGYTEETKKEGAKRIAPLLVKYNLQNTLFGKWGAEIEAGMFFGGLIVASVQAVRAAKAAEAEQVEQSKTAWFAKFFKWAK